MLDTSPSNLFSEVQASEAHRDAHLSLQSEMIAKYTSSAYSNRTMEGDDWPENHMYEFIRLTTSKVIFDNPRVRVKTRRPGQNADVAKSHRHGLNRWIRDVNLRQILKRIYVEMCFSYSIAQTVVEPQPWKDPRDPETPHRPMVYRLEPDRFIIDPLATSWGAARWMGHKWVRDKDDLLELAEDKDNGWNADNIEAVSTGTGTHDLNRDKTAKDNIDRKEIVGYEIWVPEAISPEEEDGMPGMHGTLYTLAAYPTGEENDDDGKQVKKAEWLREPRGFYGSPAGPYTMFGVYPVPGNIWPLSPFAATFTQMSSLNDVVQASQRGISQYKRITLVSAENPDLAKKVKSSRDSYVVPVKGFAREQVETIEMGGITEQHLSQLSQSLDRLDRNTGITEFQRGNLTGNNTATEVSLANSASEGALAFIKQEFTESVVRVLQNVSWYFANDDRIMYHLGEEAAAEEAEGLRQLASRSPEVSEAIDSLEREELKTIEEMSEPQIRGGGVDVSDLELEIEPYSMERTNEAMLRQQYQEMVGLYIQAVPVIAQSPWLDWKAIFQKGGEVMNDPTWGDVVNEEMLNQAAQQLQQQQQGMGEEQAGPRPGPGMEGQQAGGQAGRPVRSMQ